MTDLLPRDLEPLPTSPWEERPAEIPLDVEECRTALWLSRGNVNEAAKKLKISSSRLRRFVDKSPRLKEVLTECQEILKDIAEENIYDALTDGDDPQRRDSASKFVLTNLAADRGYGKNTGINIKTGDSPKGRLLVAWDNGESISGGDTVIEGEANGS